MNPIEILCIAVVFAGILLFGEKLHIIYRPHKKRTLLAAGGSGCGICFYPPSSGNESGRQRICQNNSGLVENMVSNYLFAC
jgi:hypothetical protein